MGLGTALYTAVSGLDAMSSELSVIGNNISNSGTIGFKDDTASFANMLSTSVGGTSGIEAGNGVQLQSIASDFSQGTLQTTTNPLDMAIQGAGFFVVKDPDGSGYYTRAGQFSVDKNGNIVTPNGEFLQGAVAVTQPTITQTGTTPGSFGAIGNINMSEIGGAQPSMTANATIFTNLQSTTQLTDPCDATDLTAAGGQVFNITNSNNAITVSNDGGVTWHTLFLNTSPAGGYTSAGLATELQNVLTATGDHVGEKDSQGNVFVPDVTATASYTPYLAAANTISANPYTFNISSGAGTLMFDWSGKSDATNNPAQQTSVNDLSNILGFSSNYTGVTGGTVIAGTMKYGITSIAAASSVTGDFQTAGFDPNSPPTTAFSTAMTMYDSAGNSHLVNVYFEKVDDTNVNVGAATTIPGDRWMWWAVVPSSSSANGQTQVCGQGTLEFNTAGALVDAGAQTYDSVNFSGGVSQNQQVVFDFGQKEDYDIVAGGSGTNGTTSYGSSSGVTNQYQDGYASGSLDSYTVSQTGILTGTFTNGQTKNIALIQLARFNAPDQLTNVGNNMYSQSSGSGQPIPGLAGNAGFGNIFSSSLEESNVDLSSEFVNMITVQSAYQASAKVISTSQELFTALEQAKQ